MAACLTDQGFDTPRLHSHDDYSGIPYASASVETTSGYYEVTIWRTGHQAFVYAYQRTSFAGAGSAAVHASYQGRVALFSSASNRHRGDESRAYFVQRTAVARCAYAIPAATGRPAYVY